MKRINGLRPLSIRLFAASFILQGLLIFIWAMFNRDAVAATIFANSGARLSDDWVIVITSARLSIAFIPTALVWFFASSFARWMAALLAVVRLFNLPAIIGTVLQGHGIAFDLALNLGSLALALFAAAMLFTHQSRDWFARKGRPDAQYFE